MTDLVWTPIKIRLGQIRPWEANPRMSTKAQAQRLIKSERELGQIQTLAVSPFDGDFVDLYDGHQRCAAWMTVKQPSYEVTALQSNRPLSEDERRKVSVLFHTATGSWSWDALSSWSVADLREWGMDSDTLKGWNNDANNLKELLNAEQEEPHDAEPQIDRAAELQEKWQTASGQLWQLGKHRLLIGDCTVRGNVERLMGGERADLVFTSPPYAAQREYEIGSFDWDALMFGMSSNAVEFSGDDVSLLINLGIVHAEGMVSMYWDKWIAWMNSDLMPLYGWYVWDKLSGLMGDWKGRLAPAHEFIFHFSKNPRQAHKTTQTKYAEQGVTHYKKNKVGLRSKDGTLNGFTSAGKEVNQTKIIDSVIRVQPQRGGMEGHPAPFSVEFAQTLIEVFSDVGHVVYEPFCGSGTTILACQNLARKCYSTELSDKYAGIILERFFEATGINPELVSNG